MTDPVQRLATAETQAAAARERLSATLTALQERLNPKRLAREAADDMVDARSVAAASASRHPGALAGLVAVAGLFLARHRIAALFGRQPRAQSHAFPADLPSTSQRNQP